MNTAIFIVDLKHLRDATTELLTVHSKQVKTPLYRSTLHHVLLQMEGWLTHIRNYAVHI